MSPEIDLIIYLCGSKTNTEGFPLSPSLHGGDRGRDIVSLTKFRDYKVPDFYPQTYSGKEWRDREREGGTRKDGQEERQRDGSTGREEGRAEPLRSQMQ